MNHTLFEHADGRYRVAPGTGSPAWTEGDPGWVRLGPVEVDVAPPAPAAVQGQAKELHAAILNLPCSSPFPANTGGDNCYRVGHRAALGAAAELVSATLPAAGDAATPAPELGAGLVEAETDEVYADGHCIHCGQPWAGTL